MFEIYRVDFVDLLDHHDYIAKNSRQETLHFEFKKNKMLTTHNCSALRKAKTKQDVHKLGRKNRSNGIWFLKITNYS